MRVPSFPKTVVILVLIAGIVPITWAASNLNLSKSNINRVNGAQLVAGTTTLAPGESAVVYPIVQGGDFILTQFCASPVAGGVRLAAAGFGSIAQTGEALCYTFNPGMVLPRPSELICSINAAAPPGDYFCAISGLFAR